MSEEDAPEKKKRWSCFGTDEFMETSNICRFCDFFEECKNVRKRKRVVPEKTMKERLRCRIYNKRRRQKHKYLQSL